MSDIKKPKISDIITITIVWTIVQVAIYYIIGIRPNLESLKYIKAAEQLLNTGTLPESRYYFYLITTLIIAFSIKFKFGFTGVVLIQLLLNYYAIICFFRVLTSLSKTRYAALITALVLILCIPFQVWNFYLYTESVFYSFVLLFFSSCLIKTPHGTFQKSRQLLFVLLSVLSRPLGILLLPCWLVYLILKVQKEYRVYLLTGFFVSVILFTIIANTILGTIGDWQVLRPAEKNYIICEMPEGVFKDLSQFKTNTPLQQIGTYIIHYPLHFSKLATKRAVSFFTLVRPYYSSFHNWALIGLCLVLYVPMLIRKKYLKWEKNKIFACLIICSFVLAVCFQCDDYHSRFHHAIIPVFLFIGLFTSLDSLTPENKHQIKALFGKG